MRTYFQSRPAIPYPRSRRAHSANNQTTRKRRYLFAVIFLLPLAACPINPDTELQTGSFSALTYNVAGLPEGISGSSPDQNIAQISPLLNDYELVLIQEDFAYHRELIEAADHPYQSYPKEDHTTLVNDGLNRLSDFPFPQDVERVRWNMCYGGIDFGSSDCLASKGFSFATLELASDLTIGVYNLHAEAGGGEEDNSARFDNYEQLKEHIAQQPTERAIIVGGDTNLHGYDEIDEPVFSAFMNDSQMEDVCRSLSCDNEQIDRFLFRSSSQIAIEPLTWQIAAEFIDSEGNDLSDHPAVHVDFSWSEVDFGESDD